jgi:very-short-patch-repair endonuclease
LEGEKDYDQQYQYLLESYDKNSNSELPFIRYLYDHGLALPHKTQVNIPGFYINADFVYNNSHGPTIIFCDGSVHDLTSVQEDDQHKRSLLREQGYDVIEWHYRTPLDELVSQRRDIFKKIR